MSPRVLRQVLIAVIFFSFIGAVSYWYYSSKQVIPTCNDNIKNGLEEGIDCGLAACGRYCEPALSAIEIKSSNLLKIRTGDYDFVAELLNPNRQYGASLASYELTLLDKDGQEVAKQSGQFYILPGQQKYLIINAVESSKEAETAQLKITKAQWEKLDSLEGMDFSVKNKTYSVGKGGGSSELKGVIINNSDFDFSLVDIGIVLFDDSNKILAVNKTDVRTLLSNVERAFDVVWPFLIQGKVARIDVEPTTNLYDNLNYIKRYGAPTEKFQKYY